MLTIEQACSELTDACVQILGNQPGCGFPIAPGWLVTCAHVVGRKHPPGTSITVKPWLADSRTVTLHRLDPDLDLALIQDKSSSTKSVIPLGTILNHHDNVLGIGFPQRASKTERDQFSAVYEGMTDLKNTTLLKLKMGQIEYGFSGGPLLNLHSGAIVGMTRFSRNTLSDSGGWAIPLSLIQEFCLSAGVEIQLDRALPKLSAAQHSQCLQDFLLSLPGWNQERSRLDLINRILWGNPILNSIQLNGAPQIVAGELARCFLEYSDSNSDKASIVCLLLQGVKEQFIDKISRERIAEIDTLLQLFTCQNHST